MDQGTFNLGMKMLLATFPKDLGTETVLAYRSALEDLENWEFEHAVKTWCRTGKRFPFPGDLISLGENASKREEGFGSDEERRKWNACGSTPADPHRPRRLGEWAMNCADAKRRAYFQMLVLNMSPADRVKADQGIEDAGKDMPAALRDERLREMDRRELGIAAPEGER